MRGIEAAMHIYGQCNRGAIVSESLRALGNMLSPGDRVLATTLCYAVLRRLSLWKYLRSIYMLPAPEKFSPAAQDAVLVGTAGLLTLVKFAPAVLISSLVDWTKKRDFRGSRVVNSVLRRVLERGKNEINHLKSDPSLSALCFVSGFPNWAACFLCERYGEKEGRELVSLSSGGASLSLRLSPDAPRELPLEIEKILKVSESPFPECLRLNGTHLPSSLPGYKEGWITPQSESSVVVGNEVADFDGRYLLDMCTGRGVKAGQIAQLRPDAVIEGWDLSEGRIAAAQRDMLRLKVENVEFHSGNSLSLEPQNVPDAVLVDAPCSGSGTWRRHPEGKWRIGPEDIRKMAELQKKLLSRAFDIVKSGGKVVYSTCSLFAEENEDVVSATLADFPNMREVPPAESPYFLQRKHGFASRPENPWSDGFYMAAFIKG